MVNKLKIKIGMKNSKNKNKKEKQKVDQKLFASNWKFKRGSKVENRYLEIGAAVAYLELKMS